MTTVIKQQIKELEQEIFRKKRALAELRKKDEQKHITNYELREADGKKVQLNKLFGDHKTLFVVQNMGKGCNYCTLWADEINGILHHMESVAPVVLASPDEPSVMAEFAKSRNWKFHLISTAGSEFKQSLDFEPKPGSPQPGVSILKMKDDGTIYQYSKANFGPGDDFCGMWSFLDLLPEEEADWHPKKKY
ncbi:DUF899 family protein [Virgibacillus litoralis]|uniref:Dithiol-disulfide oxidoreductase (DUF899 family) n=1 Tax=Virgibacillus litoralis TaxID=578221 RepID=A0ABS4HIX9_9BACI|nr:DUF899 family protein [Virgibacillus litoralis]MBP1950866.1 putative dithiol-disulfide oxidoreductase (DUF899 family) [Virgibacillus litoralis]